MTNLKSVDLLETKADCRFVRKNNKKKKMKKKKKKCPHRRHLTIDTMITDNREKER